MDDIDNAKILRLQLEQEPIPLLPFQVSTPSIFLGSMMLVLDHMFNIVEYVRYFDANFCNSFPENED